jgi:hypothetical protein
VTDPVAETQSPDPHPDVSKAQSFFLLGAMKCGTTSLYQLLDVHPEVFFSEPKEPIFFEAQYEQGLDYYRQRYFASYRGEACAGEARTHNLGLPFVPARIHQALPDAKLLAILRDPVDRAYSEWWHQYSRGRETLDFEAALEANLARRTGGQRFEGESGARAWRDGLIDGRSSASRYGLYLDLGHYAEAIERYRALFGESRLLVLFFDELERDPRAVTRSAWKFLGVDSNAALGDVAPRNTANTRVRGPAAAAWHRRVNRLPGKEWLRSVVPESILKRWYGFVEGEERDRPPMPLTAERWLLDYFAPHNRALERLLGRSLPDWFEPQSARTRPDSTATLA